MTWVKGLPCTAPGISSPSFFSETWAYFGFDDGTQTLLGHGQEGVAVRCSLHGIHSDVN